MRNAFFDKFEELYKEKNDIFLLTADLGYNLLDKIGKGCLERFYDVGVAEADMIGIASGLSLSGKNVYCYSIIPFLTMRAYEQIRVDIAYHNLNVKLIGAGGGLTYGLEGFTHFGLEDIALMKSLPNMTVVVPADKQEARAVAELSYSHKGPLYIRFEKADGPEVHDGPVDFRIGKAMTIIKGEDIALFAVGSMVRIGVEIVGKLRENGINATLINMHTIKPLDVEGILQIASSHRAIFTLEDHYIEGGLGSSVAGVLLENGFKGKFKRFGIERLEKYSGDAKHLRKKYGLAAEDIYQKILKEAGV